MKIGINIEIWKKIENWDKMDKLGQNGQNGQI